MNDSQYTQRLRRAILNALSLTEPPYQLKVTTDVGSVSIQLRDARSGKDDFGLGKYIGGLILQDCRDNNIPEKAQEVADALRPAIEKLSVGDLKGE